MIISLEIINSQNFRLKIKKKFNNWYFIQNLIWIKKVWLILNKNYWPYVSEKNFIIMINKLTRDYTNLWIIWANLPLNNFYLSPISTWKKLNKKKNPLAHVASRWYEGKNIDGVGIHVECRRETNDRPSATNTRARGSAFEKRKSSIWRLTHAHRCNVNIQVS